MIIALHLTDSPKSTFLLARADDPLKLLKRWRRRFPGVRLMKSLPEHEPKLFLKFVSLEFAKWRVRKFRSSYVYHFASCGAFVRSLHHVRRVFDSNRVFFDAAREAEALANVDDAMPTAIADAAIIRLYQQLAGARNRLSALQAEIMLIEAELKARIGSAKGVDGLVEWTQRRSTRFDTLEFKRSHPDLYEAYSRKSISQNSIRLL
ncbi:MAG: hypothetical protein AAF850_06365 [Pseudomonadota bacterium]